MTPIKSDIKQDYALNDEADECAVKINQLRQRWLG